MARESIYGSIVVLDLALVVNSLRIVTHHMAAGERRACHTAPPLLETSSNWWVRLWGRPGEATARRFGLRHCFYITSTHDHCAVMHLTSTSMNTIDWTHLISLLAYYLTTWLHNHMVTRSLPLRTQGGMFAASLLDPNSWSHLDYRLRFFSFLTTQNMSFETTLVSF